MQVAIVCPYSFARPGGVQAQARGLARSLAGRGIGVQLFAPELRGEHPDLDGVVTVSLGGAVDIPANGSVAPLGIDPRMLVRFDLGLDPADVIHLHEAFLPAGVFATLRRPKRTGVVATFHASADGFWPYAVAAPLLRRLATRFDATTAVSPAARELVQRYVPAIEPEIVPNAVDVDAYATSPSDPWADDLGRVVLFVGRPEPRKGFGVVVDAFHAIAPDLADVHLVCVGPTEVEAPSMPHARIHCLGRVDEARKLALHRSADVVVCPSTGGESFGVIVIEGLAGGSAVVASDIPGYRSAGGQAVRYATAGDPKAWARALRELLTDGSARSALAAGAQDRAREFDWSTVTDRLLAVYERALR